MTEVTLTHTFMYWCMLCYAINRHVVGFNLKTYFNSTNLLLKQPIYTEINFWPDKFNIILHEHMTGMLESRIKQDVLLFCS